MTTAMPGEGRNLRALLVGAGSLGRSVLRAMRDELGPVDLVGVLTARHGRMIKKDGLDASLALNLVESEGLGDEAPEEFPAALEAAEPDVVIECIPQNIRSGDPALGFIRTSLDAGIHVVTANKAAIALGYRDLCHRASKTNTRFRFEATVLDGLPLFATMERIPTIQRVRGVLNATSSLVLESVQDGSTRSRGLARAQAQGIAEADSVLDLDGWDAAAKAALIGNVCMDGSLRVVDVVRRGCETLKDSEIQGIDEYEKYRLVAEIVRDEAGVRASVEPVILKHTDPFYHLRGGCGGVTIETSNELIFTMSQNTHGLDDAAIGVMRDCAAIHRDLGF